jgi:hypothetical protein
MHPWTAFLTVMAIAAMLSNYGVIKGSLMLFDILVGIAIYKMIISRKK